MANTHHWDTGTATPVDGNKGMSRIQRKDSGEWETQDEIFTKVDGEWKRVNKAWVKQDGEWKPTYWAPKVGETLVYAPTVAASVWSHVQTTGQGCHWNELYNPSAKYLGGDPFVESNWETYLCSYHNRGGNYSHNKCSGWVTGMASVSHHGATMQFQIGGDGSKGTDYTTGNHAAPHGSFCPVAHAYGSGQCAGPYYGRAGYDNSAELYLSYPNTTVWSY